MAITPFKVIQGHHFGTNRKAVYDFLCVNNSNLHPILRIFQDMAIINGEMFGVYRGASL